MARQSDPVILADVSGEAIHITSFAQSTFGNVIELTVENDGKEASAWLDKGICIELIRALLEKLEEL